MTDKLKDDLPEIVDQLSELPEVVDLNGEPVVIRDRALGPHKIQYDEAIGRQVRELARLGLSKNAVRIVAKASKLRFDDLYGDDFYEGQAMMQNRIAMLAMEQAEAGNVPMLMYLCKTKLGWNETNIVEHVGEVRSVVSAVPMTREQFEQRYLNVSKDDSED